MLSDDLGIAREDLGTVGLALLAGVVLGFMVGWVLYSGDGDTASPRPASEGTAGEKQERQGSRRARDPMSRAALLGALDRGLKAVRREHDGTAQAAVAIEGQSLLARGDASTQPWQMMRLPAAIAALTAQEEQPSGDFEDALTTVLREPEPCAEWRVLLELQERVGDPAKARDEVAKVFARAKAPDAKLAEAVGQPEPDCREYLEEHGKGLKDPDGSVPLLESSSWTISDAAALTRAIGTGKYGKAGATVERAMREGRAVDLGAGRVLADFEPAYATGWSGSADADYRAGQIAIVDVAGRKVAVAAVFHPDEQPADADPTKTQAGAALEAVFRELAQQFEAAEARR